jgi:hypothetical protein
MVGPEGIAGPTVDPISPTTLRPAGVVISSELKVYELVRLVVLKTQLLFVLPYDKKSKVPPWPDACISIEDPDEQLRLQP